MPSTARRNVRAPSRRADAAWRAPRRLADESGLTLIELMVAFALLAIMLAATAGSLIAFTRTSAENERRVQATALLNEVQERMQAAPWESLGVYDNELDPIAEMGTYVAGNPGTLDGDELVQMPSWDDGTCTWETFEEAVACGRDVAVPRTEQVVEFEGRQFTVRSAVSWVDRSGDGIGDVKRLTSVATWELLGRTFEERFVSERAPTNIEAGDPQRPRLIQFDLAPRSAELTGDHRLPGDIEVRARFTAGVSEAELRFWVIEEILTETVTNAEEEEEEVIVGATLTETSLALSGLITDPEDATKYVSFRGAIPASAGHQFTDGPRRIRAVGIDGGEEYQGSRTLELAGEVPHEPDEEGDDPPPDGDDDEPGDDTPLEITSVTLSSPTTITLENDSGSRLFCQDLTVAAYVDGLNDDEDLSSVTMSYSVGSEQVSNRPLNPDGAISGSNDRFAFTFEAGQDHGFRHNHQTTFDIHVDRVSGGDTSKLGGSDTLVTFTNAGGGGC